MTVRPHSLENVSPASESAGSSEVWRRVSQTLSQPGQQPDIAPALPESASRHLPGIEVAMNGDALPTSAAAGGVAQTLANIAAADVGRSMYLPRPGSRYSPKEVPPESGCTSTTTNMLFDALLKDGLVTQKQYRQIHEINVTDFMRKATNMGIVERVAGGLKNAQAGDILVGINGGDRHMGVLVPGAKGELRVVNNHAGTVGNDTIGDRFGRYPQIFILRPTGHVPH